MTHTDAHLVNVANNSLFPCLFTLCNISCKLITPFHSIMRIIPPHDMVNEMMVFTYRAWALQTPDLLFCITVPLNK